MDQNGHLLKEIKANPPLHKTIKLDSEWIPTGLVGSSMDFSQPLFTCPVWPQLLVAKFALKVAFHISGCGEGRYTSMLSDDSMIIYLCMRLYVQLCHCSSSWQHRPLDWTWNIARNTTPAASIYIYIHIYHLEIYTNISWKGMSRDGLSSSSWCNPTIDLSPGKSDKKLYCKTLSERFL